MHRDFHRENQWWVSPYNFAEKVTENWSLPADVAIHDATLRDGEQTPGVVMSVEDKIAIAEKLDEVGIDRIEAGLPAVSEQDFTAIKAIAGRGLKAKIFTLSRAIIGDVDKALECGADGIILEVPIGYPKLVHQFGWTWEDVLRKSVEVVRYARDRGLYVGYFAYDTTRAREEDLENLIPRLVQEAPPSSIAVVDTMACALPETIKFMVRWMKQLSGGLPVEVHTHNDFGMGVATELAGMEAGAEVLHSCCNGLGERTGNAATEELVAALQILYGYEKGYDMAKLPELGALVSQVSNIPIPRNKPILGGMNYTRESGMGVDLVMKQPLAMFATDPALTGRAGDIVLGKKSGKASITYHLEQMGIEASGEAVSEMLMLVKAMGIEKRRILTDEEFRTIASDVLGRTVDAAA